MNATIRNAVIAGIAVFSLAALAATTNTVTAKVYGEIANGEPNPQTGAPLVNDSVVDLLHKLETASYGETLVINVWSPGGYTDTAEQIYGLMHSTKATTVVNIHAVAASAAAVLICQADSLGTVDNNAIIMFHTLQELTATGETPEDPNPIDPGERAILTQWENSMWVCVTKGILTKDEYTRAIYNHQEIWLTGAQVKARVRAHSRHFFDPVF